MIGLEQLSGPVGSNKVAKRVGRGIGSGHGKTSTRGTKGRGARGNIRPGFEGGQTPLQRRLRKLKGVSQSAMNIGVFHKEYVVVNVGQLDQLAPHTNVTPDLLLQLRIIRDICQGVRVLGGGELSKPLNVQAAYFSSTAAAKITAAGGSMEVR
jgi:large subunit ribosomal protein L15